MITKDNIIFFDTDDELIDYVLSDVAVIEKSPKGNLYYDYDFTPLYYDALNSNIIFCVNDPKSLVMKRRSVWRGMITKRIQNLMN